VQQQLVLLPLATLAPGFQMDTIQAIHLLLQHSLQYPKEDLQSHLLGHRTQASIKGQPIKIHLVAARTPLLSPRHLRLIRTLDRAIPLPMSSDGGSPLQTRAIGGTLKNVTTSRPWVVVRSVLSPEETLTPLVPTQLHRHTHHSETPTSKVRHSRLCNLIHLLPTKARAWTPVRRSRRGDNPRLLVANGLKRSE